MDKIKAVAKAFGATSEMQKMAAGAKWAKHLLDTPADFHKTCEENFEEADKDGSGALDKAETIAMIKKICEVMHIALPKEERVLMLYNKCDMNGDGELQEREFEGFFKAVLKSAVAKLEKEMAKESKKIGGAKNGGTRMVSAFKAPKFYPADDIPEKVLSDREMSSRGVAKLRPSLTPGTIVILLSGRFRGRRCVFLKQLASGLMLVSGPYAVNGIPLRRVNSAYVIATSAKVDVSGVDTKKFNDAYFAKPKAKKSSEFMAEEAKPEVSATRLADQKACDAKLQAAVDKVPLMAKYLKARFSLSRAEAPHKMKF